MARDLERLIQKKDNAHDGMISTTDTEAHAMIAWAQRLITLRRVEAVLPSASPRRSFVRELERMGADRLQ